MLMMNNQDDAGDDGEDVDDDDDDDADEDVLLYLSDAAAQYLICKFQLDRVVHFWQNSLSKVDFRE